MAPALHLRAVAIRPACMTACARWCSSPMAVWAMSGNCWHRLPGAGPGRLFPVAIGAAPNSRFMRKAAEIGRGSHTHIGRPQDVAERMDALWPHIRLPALTDICIDWGMQAEYYPELLPDLYAGQPLVAVRPAAGRTHRVSLCGQLNGQAWWHEVWPGARAGSATLATLWAGAKSNPCRTA